MAARRLHLGTAILGSTLDLLPFIVLFPVYNPSFSISHTSEAPPVLMAPTGRTPHSTPQKRTGLLSLPTELILQILICLPSASDFNSLIQSHSHLRVLWDHHKDVVWRASVSSITGIGVGVGKKADTLVATYSELAKRLMMKEGGGERLRCKLTRMVMAIEGMFEGPDMSDAFGEVKERLKVMRMIEWVYTLFIEPYMPLLDALSSIPGSDYRPSVTTIDRPTIHERISFQQTLLSLLFTHEHLHELRYTDGFGDVDDDDDNVRPVVDANGEFMIYDGNQGERRILPSMLVFDARGFIERVGVRENLLIAGVFESMRLVESGGANGYLGLPWSTPANENQEEESDAEARLWPRQEPRIMAMKFRECYTHYSLNLYVWEILRDRLFSIQLRKFHSDSTLWTTAVELRTIARKSVQKRYQTQVDKVLSRYEDGVDVDETGVGILGSARYRNVKGMVWRRAPTQALEKADESHLVDELEEKILWIPYSFPALNIWNAHWILNAYDHEQLSWFRADEDTT